MVGFFRALMRSKPFKGRFFRKLLVLSLISIFFWLALSNKAKDQEGNRSRDADTVSPFHWIQHRTDKALRLERGSWFNPFSYSFLDLGLGLNDREMKLLINWEESAKVEKCRYMIDVMYLVNPSWTNSLITYYYGQDVDDLLISLLGERLRSFNYCFSSADEITLEDVLGIESVLDLQNPLNISSEDYMRRMFPFFKDVTVTMKPLWPEITNLRTDIVEPRPNLAPNFNENFWSYWREYAQGKGIVITLAERTKPLFFKQIKVLEHMGNKLPIQVVTKGTEFSKGFISELSKFVKTTNQQIYLVDCAPLLDTTFAGEFINNVVNKWLAVIFNTFEEIILLDVDAVPFIPLEQFLEDPKYKSTGMLLYKDRNMPNEHTFSYCIHMLAEVEPSYQEDKLLKSKLKFLRKQKSFDESEEASVYQNFFHDMLLHHVDSGLVVINKSSNLNGLIFSFMLHLDGKMQRCVYGDKEIFWLGQLYAGETYSIHPVDGGIVGPVTETLNEDNSQTTYQICGAQIAHSSEHGELLWTNGGLQTCKIIDSAANDFENNYNYFEDRYGTIEELQNLYDSPLRIEGVIVPNINQNPWIQLLECAKYTYCATATSGAMSKKGDHMIQFDKRMSQRLTNIAKIWNES